MATFWLFGKRYAAIEWRHIGERTVVLGVHNSAKMGRVEWRALFTCSKFSPSYGGKNYEFESGVRVHSTTLDDAMAEVARQAEIDAEAASRQARVDAEAASRQAEIDADGERSFGIKTGTPIDGYPVRYCARSSSARGNEVVIECKKWVYRTHDEWVNQE